MLFNSYLFAVFLPVIFILYWTLPHKFRWALMLIASYYFYMCWSAKHIFLILFITIISYFAARLLEKEDSIKKKRWILVVTAISCLGVLFFFKYFNFVSESFVSILQRFAIQVNPVTLNLLLPVGISFYTFQALSYVIDVYNGNAPAEHHFGKYAAFISFFPQLVAGPIERTNNLLPQIKVEHKFDYNQVSYGLKLMAWGYFKKIVIADTLSGYVSTVYDKPQNYHGFALVLATIFFTIQIYCDFSGYSDIAIGTAKLLGIDLMTNFKSPYFSQTVKEFWNRWHISLSTWFRDYVYIPLGGNRVSRIRHYVNLMITFLISGLWHGANWTFIVWGGVHGAAQVIENIIFPKSYHSKGIVRCFRTLFIFLFCSFAWIFFVANSIGDAVYVIGHSLEGISTMGIYLYLRAGFSDLGIWREDILFMGVSLLILFAYDFFSLKEDVITVISSKKTIFRWGIYCIFVLWIIINIPVVKNAEFIYFQF